MSNNWWANKLGAVAPPAPQRQEMPMPPSQRPMTPYIPPQPTVQPSKAQSASQTELCPTCGSENYMAVGNAGKRCYDCGYPIEQSGSRYGSLTGARVEGPVKGSIGNNPNSNFNPQNIIGRI
jgi:ribosomal protein L37E